jgi:hypothetical protein
MISKIRGLRALRFESHAAAQAAAQSKYYRQLCLDAARLLKKYQARIDELQKVHQYELETLQPRTIVYRDLVESDDSFGPGMSYEINGVRYTHQKRSD